mmetsp:Transcript_57606/g.185008  ORF Transcript_57606/g.185008 Transcript_57606/m.185008 type:complete len:277 (-) Transcript_57606:626-1456(-)
MAVDVAAAVPVEELKGRVQLGLRQRVQLLVACNALQPRASAVLVLLVVVLQSEPHVDGKVVRRVVCVRDHLAGRQLWDRSHLQDLELAAEELHHVDAALPGLCDRCRAGRHVAGAPQELVDRAALDLPDGAREPPNLGKVPRVQVAHEDHRGVRRPMRHGEVSEALHDLRDLPHADRRLRPVVRVLGQVRRDHDQHLPACLPFQQSHEAAAVALVSALRVSGVHKVEGLLGNHGKLRASPEEAASVERCGPRALVEDRVPCAAEGLREVRILIELD